jgi:hypothetical protein
MAICYPKNISILLPCVLSCSPDAPPAFYHVTHALTTYRSSHNEDDPKTLAQEFKHVASQYLVISIGLAISVSTI